MNIQFKFRFQQNKNNGEWAVLMRRMFAKC